MSTTKLPEAFERKIIQGKDFHLNSMHDGYNACLEATGAKELWEALNELLTYHGDTMMASPSINDLNRFRAALAKSNPSNTVG